MKLLPKSQVLQRVNEKRRFEIEDGVQLAKKIDALREAYAEEEQKLYKFRTETMKIVHKEIDVLIQDRDDLKREVEIYKHDIEYYKGIAEAEAQKKGIKPKKRASPIAKKSKN